ncbi:MAG TPA: MarR family transcriptional regulator [Longimicrobium sp.]
MREADDAACAPPGADDLRLERQLCFALYSAANLTTRLYRPLLEPLGITYPQYLAMLALWERAPRSVGALGGALGLDSGTLTPLLKRLEAGGLVTRTRDAADERRVLVGLTPAGLDLRARGRHPRDAALRPSPAPGRRGRPPRRPVALRAGPAHGRGGGGDP